MAMESEEKAEEVAAGQQSRRTVPRFDVDEDAHLLLVKHGATLPCRIVDLSLSGCRVCTQERFPAGTMVQVEVNFSVRGLAFRFRGLTQWTDGRHQVGIRFVDLPERRKEELIEALSEVEEENVAKAARLAAEKLAAEEQAAALEAAEAALLAAVAAARRDQEEAPCRPPVLGPVETIAGRPVLPASRPTRLKLRSPSRTEVDTSVLIHLIHAGSWLQAQILDLSPNGCRVSTEEELSVAIYTRVETEFRLDGLPFRLDGVIQGARDGDARNVGIRFLEMSSRKQEQVEQLIEELGEQTE
jgi:c-di-GMP-binding flagellar brake protein YcgR